MSEIERAKELRGRFLHAAYHLGMNRTARLVALDEIAAEMQNYISTDDPHFVDRLVDIAQYLGERGFIKSQADGYGLLSITAAGIDEVESGEQEYPRSIARPGLEGDFPSRKEQRRGFLRMVYELAGGNPVQWVYWRDLAPRLGLDAEDQAHTDYAIAIAEYLKSSGLLSIEVDEGSIYTITAAGIDEVERDEPQMASSSPLPTTPDEFRNGATAEEPPVEIRESLGRFRRDYPDPGRVAFIMMQFGETPAHKAITQAIRDALNVRGIIGVRADDKRYHDDLFPNVLTYMYGCGLGIAVFERLEADETNPNVALEVGYLFAMQKPVCLLKDRTLRTLQADLVGKLYDPFDPQDPMGTIQPVVQKWLSDK